MSKILVVDDEPEVVDILKYRLEKDDHTVLSAGDGRAGLALAFACNPDLAIVDVMMPGLDGFEVVFQMKNNPRTSQIPVIMLTAKSDFSSIAKGWNLDVDNYVTKPFDIEEFVQTVRNVLIYRGKIKDEE